MMADEEMILGVDPGTNITGFGIIKACQRSLILVDYGAIRLPSSLALSQRYRIIHESIAELIVRHRPTALVTETQYVNKNVQSAMKLGMARGVVMLAATLQEIEVFEYAPSKAKRAVTGTGAASKQQVQKMMQLLLGLSSPPEPEDAADALALALCHAHLLAKNKHREYQI
jgi:crossover junction endodeoxyribonuclease RuvC